MDTPFRSRKLVLAIATLAALAILSAGVAVFRADASSPRGAPGTIW